MCPDEGTRGGDGTADAARSGIGGKGRGGLCQWFRWRIVDDKAGEGDERDARESSLQPGRRLRGGKVTGRKETCRKTMGAKATEGNVTGAKAQGVQDSQETGGKGDMLMGEREMNNMLPSDATPGLNETEGIPRKCNSEVLKDGVKRRARVFVGGSIVRKTHRNTGSYLKELSRHGLHR